MSNSTIFSCVITVQGRKALYGHETGYHGSTVRPLHDQTRPVRDFFRGMSCYSGAVRRHVASCEKCRRDLWEPEAALAFRTAPATFRGNRVVRSFLRKGVVPQEARSNWVAALSPGSETSLWAAAFLSPGETWDVLRNSVAHFSAHCQKHGYKQETVASWTTTVTNGMINPVGEFSYRNRPLHEAASSRTPEANRDLLRIARTMMEAGAWELPETVAEARELLPAALVHGS